MKNEILNVNEACGFLKISRRTFDYWRQKGIAPPHAKVGGKILFRKSALLDWIAQNEIAQAA